MSKLHRIKKFYLILLVTILLGVHFFSFSQEKLDQPAPIDLAIRMGKLGNGMTYYIRHNEEPKDRVSFYIIQNVGALLENDSQNGLAHFLEHMAFNGTQNYPGKGFLDYLEKNGVAFGRNINAYTAFNETVYNLSSVPSKNPGLIDSCLLVLHDWSHYLLLTDEEIDAERGVISEEWRTRRNADFRMRSQYFPVLLKDSKFAVRDIIGDLDLIKNFEYNTLRQFYHDWYRTDLQAIAIVGDIDVNEIENKIKELFSEIPAVENPMPRPFFEVPEHKETRYVLATDKEATSSRVSIYIKHKATEPSNKNLNYLRDGYVQSLFNQMASDRINEVLQKGNPPFVIGDINYGNFIRGYDVAIISITANPNQEDLGLRAIYTEAQRLKRYGFTESELKRAKTNMLMSKENSYKQRDKISNDMYVRGIQEHFLKGEPLTSPEFDWEFAQKAIQGITLEEVSAIANDYFVPENRVVIIQGPEGADVNHLTEAEAKSILTEVENSNIEPYEDTAEITSLINEELKGSAVVSTKNLEEFDAVEWKLANNAKVVFKHADFEKNSISLQAFSNGGTSKLNTGDLATANMLEQFVGSFGVGEFDAITLKKALTGKKASIAVSLDELSESFSGSSSPEDFETMMQLLYLQFTHPRFDDEAYNALKSRYISFFANMDKNPQKIMSDSTQMIFSNYNERTKLITPNIFDEISLAKMQKIYNDRYIDAGDFTFLIVGNINKEEVKEMAIKYIGSLKDDPREETWVDQNIRWPDGKNEKRIAVPLQTAKANITVSFKKEMAYTPENNILISVLQAILRLRYTEEVREKEGGTYGVSVSSGSQLYPYEFQTLQMKFDADPERADHLKSLIYKEIDLIIKDGPLAVDLEKVVLNMKKDREQSKPHNNYWMNTIYNYYYYGVNNDAKENFEDVLEELTTEKIQVFAKLFFADADVIDLMFVPKQTE